MVPHSPEIPNRVEIFSPSLLIATFLARLIFKRVLRTWKREKRKKKIEEQIDIEYRTLHRPPIFHLP